MSSSRPSTKTKSHSTDMLLVEAPVSHLESLRKKGDVDSLYMAVVVGASFMEQLGLLWFKSKLDSENVEFHWKDNFPHLNASQVIALLNSIGLIDDTEYGKFMKCASDRNFLVHHMYSKWTKTPTELAAMAKGVMECVETIVSKSGLKPPKLIGG